MSETAIDADVLTDAREVEVGHRARLAVHTWLGGRNYGH
jgi:hypothetical protein